MSRLCTFDSRCGLVDTVKRILLEDEGLFSPKERDILLPPRNFRRTMGRTQFHIQMEKEAISQEVRRPERENDYEHPCGGEMKRA